MKKLIFPFLFLVTQISLAASQNNTDDQSSSGSAIWGFLFTLLIIGVVVYIIRRNRRKSIENVNAFYEYRDNDVNGNSYPPNDSSFVAGVAAGAITTIAAEELIDSLDNGQQPDDQANYDDNSDS